MIEGASAKAKAGRHGLYERQTSTPSKDPEIARDRSSATRIGEIYAALQPINSIISRFCKIRRKYGFEFDDIIIIAACGAINFSAAKEDVPFAQPANISSIAEYIDLPRETVRRKLQIIESRGFVQRYSGGYLIKNVEEWLTIVGLLTSDTH